MNYVPGAANQISRKSAPKKTGWGVFSHVFFSRLGGSCFGGVISRCAAVHFARSAGGELVFFSIFFVMELSKTGIATLPRVFCLKSATEGQSLSVWARHQTAGRRLCTGRAGAGLEAVGLVHEHNFGNGLKGYTSIRMWFKKTTLRPWVVAPITMAATSGAFAGGGGRAAAASSTGTTIAEVSAGHRSPRSSLSLRN